MRVAVPLFGNQVAFGFWSSDRFLIADVENGEIVCERQHRIRVSGRPERLSEKLLVELVGLGVKIILYGGNDLNFIPLSESKGIHVIDGVWGDAREAIELFSRGGIALSGGRGWSHGRVN
jgi:predicted Fe-Mo cluster-binding NifX family protein